MKMSPTVALASLVIVLTAGMLFRATAQEAGNSPAATPPAAEAARVAVVDVLSVLERLVESDRYRPARDAFQAQQNDKVNAVFKELQTLGERINAMPETAPERAGLIEQYRSKEQEAQDIRTAVEDFNTRQVTEAYRLAIQTASAVADARGYSHVLASRTDDLLIRSATLSEALQEILARPVLRAPAGDNITSVVLEQLDVQDVVPPKAENGQPVILPESTPPK